MGSGDRATPATGAEERFEQIVEALAEVAAGVSLPTVLRHIVESTCRLVDARYGALGVIGDDQRLIEFVAHGAPDDMLDQVGHYPEGLGILGLLIVEPKPLRVRDLTQHPASYGFPEGHPPMHSFLGVPIVIGDDVFGNLYLCEKQGAEEFDEEDERLAVSVAGVAAVAIENVRLHERFQDLAVLQDRERIARDLHDKVIQRVFAAGMALQATARLAAPEVADRIVGAVDELDAIIAEVRSTIFALEARPADRPNISAVVLDLVDHTTRAAGIEPAVRIDGALNNLVTPELGEELLAVLREALANAVRHSGARHIDVTVSADRDLAVVVRDDGHGLADPAARGHGHGLANLTSRAQARGGTFSIGPSEPGGTVLEWRVPLLG
ncbi:MAG: GAF domain-containing protein [Acidimicrobiia bacterium]